MFLVVICGFLFFKNQSIGSYFPICSCLRGSTVNNRMSHFISRAWQDKIFVC